MDERWAWRANEVALAAIIVIQLLDFFKLLTPFWDYVNKVINWVLIGYLVWLASPSGIIFGIQRRAWDAAVVCASFLLVLKSFLHYASVARAEMLAHVYGAVALVPSAAKGVLTVTLNESAYRLFSVTGLVEGAAPVVRSLATQLTFATPSIPITVSSGTESATLAVQAYGLDGMTLRLFNTLLTRAGQVELWCFALGGLALLGLGTYAALRFAAPGRSVLSQLHEAQPQRGVKALTRALVVVLLLAAFFVIIFNFAAEWLAMAVDSSFTMLGVAAFLLVLVRARRMREQDPQDPSASGRIAGALDAIGNFGNDFLQGFGRLFQQPETAMLAVAGLLVLHMLVDIGVFLVPYLLGLRDPLYLAGLGAGHAALWTHVSWGLSAQEIGFAVLYLLNAVGILALFALPAYIWLKSYRLRTRAAGQAESEHHPDLPGWLVALLLGAISSLALAPAFSLRAIESAELVGVDLSTHAIAAASPWNALLLASALFAGTLVASRRFRRELMAALFVCALLFFCVYVYQFFMSSVRYYLHEISTLLHAAGGAELIAALWLFAFLAVTLLFYVFGALAFVYELARE